MDNNRKEDNKQLLLKYLNNRDKESFLSLFEGNKKLIKYVIRKIVKFDDNFNFSNYYEDIFQVGSLGLTKAISTFDIEKIDDVSFSTFAISCIKNEILTELSKYRKSVKTCIHFEDEFSGSFLGSKSNFKEFPSFDEYENYYEKLTFEEGYNDENDVIEEFVDKEYDKYKKKKIESIVKTLNSRDRMVVELFFGLNKRPCISKNRIAAQLGVSEFTVNRILNDAKEYFKEQLKEFSLEYGKDDKEKNKTSNKNKSESFHLLDMYSLEEIKEGIKYLSEKEGKIMTLYYGADGNGQRTYNEICIELDLKEVRSRISKIKSKLLIILNNLQLMENNKELNEFQILEVCYGKINIENALELLLEDEKAIINLYYGLNGKKSKSINEIESILNIDNVDEKLQRSVNKIKKILDNPQAFWSFNRNENMRSMKQLINKYGRDRIQRAINLLKEKNKEIIELYYFNDKDILSQGEIASKVGVTDGFVSKFLQGSIDIIKKNINQQEVLKKQR